MSRPEYVHCIRRPKESEKHLSWCGSRIAGFHLTGLDHAACLDSSRLQPCGDCVEAAMTALGVLSHKPLVAVTKDSLAQVWDDGLDFAGDCLRAGCSLTEAANGNPWRK